MSQRAQDVILASDGNPFKTKKAAVAHANETNLDPDDYGILPQGDGFALVRKNSGVWQTHEKLGDEHKAAAEKAPAKERYFRVRFHAKSSPSDTAHVELCVNCEVLIMQRERDVVLPERFVRHAQLCRYPDERQVPGQPRKTVGWVQIYPFTILGEATKAEFVQQRREGTELTRKAFTVDESAPSFDGVSRQDVLDGVAAATA